MLHETIYLRGDDPAVNLTTYVANEHRVPRDAMLVIPGGGYREVCTDREGEPIALAFLARGFNCFVLHYSVGERAVFPRPLCDASLAMAHIRQNATRYGICPERVFVVGFSAGGHLCASLGSLWDEPEVREACPTLRPEENRPTGTILCYAVLSANCPTHRGSFVHLSGKADPTQQELQPYSIDTRISGKTSPAFFVHTVEDRTVPVQNALLTMQAMKEHGISYEARLYPHGPHGIALADFQTALGDPTMVIPEAAHWVEDAVAWTRTVPSLAL